MENPRVLTPIRHTDLNVKMNGGVGSALPVFPIKAELRKCIQEKLGDQIIQLTVNKKQIAELKSKVENLEERFVNGEISKEQFVRFSSKYSADIKKLSDETAQAVLVSSNLEKAIDKGLKIASELSTVWASSDFAPKQNLQYLVFPEGIMYDKKNNTVRTTRINSLFAAIPLLAGGSEKNKTGNHQNDYLLSSTVGMTGFEPATPTSRT